MTNQKNISMKIIMEGLGIDVGDIVCISSSCEKDFTALKCNEKYDLVSVDGDYSSRIPNYILGMVSGKYDYSVYKLQFEVQQARA